jgi:hypothetical protein
MMMNQIINKTVEAPITNGTIEEKIYFIKDSEGRYNGRINIFANSDIKNNPDYKWDYYSQEYPTSGDGSLKRIEMKLERLMELNSIAGYDLNFEIVELTQDAWIELISEGHKKYEELGRNRMLFDYYSSSIVMKDIVKGCIVKHRKMVDDIYRKHKKAKSLRKVA